VVFIIIIIIIIIISRYVTKWDVLPIRRFVNFMFYDRPCCNFTRWPMIILVE